MTDRAVQLRNSLQRTFSQIQQAIDLCTEPKLTVPSLMLVYAAIDIAGWLDSDGDDVEAGFTGWVRKYLAPENNFGCTPLDLYGARCGVLHTFGPESRKSKKGIARRIYYAWGNEEAGRLQEFIDLGQEAHEEAVRLREGQGAKQLAVKGENLTEDFRAVAISVANLCEGFRAGVSTFIDDLVAGGAERIDHVLKKVEKVFTTMPPVELDALHEWGKHVLTGSPLSPEAGREAMRVLYRDTSDPRVAEEARRFGH